MSIVAPSHNLKSKSKSKAEGREKQTDRKGVQIGDQANYTILRTKRRGIVIDNRIKHRTTYHASMCEEKAGHQPTHLPAPSSFQY
jgi:hypothetical protein